MGKQLFVTASLLAALAVILGAFGAHGLKQLVPPETVTTFETGVRYQFYHVFAIFITGLLYMQWPHRFLKTAYWFFLIGILLFSGSLYALTLLKATDTVGLSKLGIVTPFGGVFFVLGWILLALGLLKRNA